MPEELQSLEESKGIYREMLKGLNLEIAATKKKLDDLMNRWGDINKEYERLDRRIAFETKVTIVKHKPSKTPEMTSEQAREMLALLTGLTQKDVEEEDEVVTDDDLITEEDL